MLCRRRRARPEIRKELPSSGVSRAVFGARHDSHREDIVFMLLRGVGPHSHPRTESSGVVWGRPSPPALDSSRRGAMCRSRRGACLQSIGHPGRSDLHLLVAVLASPQMPSERGREACTHRGWPGGVGASGPSVHGTEPCGAAGRAREHSVLPSPGRGVRPRRIGGRDMKSGPSESGRGRGPA